MSCISADACTAAGYYVNGTGQILPLAERWNGTRWAIQPTPSPAGAPASGFLAVSCTSPGACTAAGEYRTSLGKSQSLAERWNGTRWIIEATPGPAGAQASELFGVSCAGPRRCIAAGDFANVFGTTQTLAEAWDGTRWVIQATPNPDAAISSGLVAVSCRSAGACTVVGSYGTSSGTTASLAEQWNGTNWRIQPTPSLPGATDTELNGISCSSPSDCTAAGFYDSTRDKTLAERWDGTRWRLQATSSPAGSLGAGFSAVSCPSASACTAVGGSTSTRYPVGLTLAAAWNGSGWRLQSSPNRVGATTVSSLPAVSCSSLRACTAVGYYDNLSAGVNGVDVTLAEHWNGTHWRIQPTSNPAGATDSELTGVSCTSVHACTAVGSSYRGNTQTTLAERWNGTRWRIQPTPNPAAATYGSALRGISCASPGACAAVGFYFNKAGHTVAFSEIWDGTRWNLRATPSPVTTGHLYGVSCISASDCTAVGDYGAEHWNGTRWRYQPTARPRSSEGASLYGVSCTSASDCTATGSYAIPTSHFPLTLAESWDGTSWRIQATPNPIGTAGRNELNGVSCTSARACTAVGYYAADDNPFTVAFAEAWNGTHWSLQKLPSRVTTVPSWLGGVSCTSAHACTAVGNAGYPVQVTLAVTTLP